MKRYKVYRSKTFKEEISKYDKILQDRFDKIETNLMFNPEYGSPLRMKAFREARFEGYRIYFKIGFNTPCSWHGVQF